MRAPFASFFVALIAIADVAHAQTIGQGGGSSVSPWRVVASLLFCLALGAAAIYVLRRRLGKGTLQFRTAAPDRRIQVVEQQYLGPQRSICLIEIDGKSYAALFAAQSTALVPLQGELAAEVVVSGDGR